LSDLVAQIEACYAREQQSPPRPVYDPAELPRNYEAITAEWMTRVLCADVADAEVTAVDLGVATSGTSNRRHIRVRYNRAGQAAQLPTALFCKATHELANRIVLGVSTGAFSEVTFYRAIRPQLAIEAPRSFYAAIDRTSFNSLVIVEDLTDSVREFCTHTTVMTQARAESQITLLAGLHGRFFGRVDDDPTLRTLADWPQFFGGTLDHGMKEGSTQGFLDAEGLIPARLYRRYDEIWSKTLQSVALHRAPKTLAHGDVHLRNWYVTAEGGMGLADWQCLHRGHWARDFGYAITTALTVDDRRRWEEGLLRLYLDRLHAAGGPQIPYETAFLAYRQQLLTALTWWTITLHPTPGMPDMQPRDSTEEFVRRIGTAMDDVDSLDSFD
jgi:hypothetical protein